METNLRTLIEQAAREGENMIPKIYKRLHDEGIWTTGRTAAMLHIIKTQTGFQLEGWKFSGTWEEGRAAGRRPPMDDLIAWAKAKGLQFKDDRQARSWAFCVARKIGREGTQRYKDAQAGNPKDIVRTPIAQMTEEVRAMSERYFTEAVVRTLLRADLKNK